MEAWHAVRAEQEARGTAEHERANGAQAQREAERERAAAEAERAVLQEDNTTLLRLHAERRASVQNWAAAFRVSKTRLSFFWPGLTAVLHRKHSSPHC